MELLLYALFSVSQTLIALSIKQMARKHVKDADLLNKVLEDEKPRDERDLNLRAISRRLLGVDRFRLTPRICLDAALKLKPHATRREAYPSPKKV